jgi:hypothetical protein
LILLFRKILILILTGILSSTLYLSSHLIFRHNLMHCALDHLGLGDYIFQNGISDEIHIKRKPVSSWIIYLRVIH